MKITHEELEQTARRIGEKNIASIRVVEELMKEINSYRAAVSGAYNFTGGHSDPEIHNGLFRTGAALSGLALVPYGNISNYPSYWETYLDCSVEPPERYWIIPGKDFMSYL